MKKFYDKYLHNGFVPCVVLAFLLDVIIESVGRGSLLELSLIHI